jgi:ubiquinone/menaquinone biosynthesis C-methylase UbiE
MAPTISATHSQARHVYDRLAPHYDVRWNRYIRATLALALEPLDLAGGERMVDIACGTGELERALLARWPRLRLAGVDLSQNMLRQAADKQLAVDWLRADATQLPFADQSFDAAVCANAFHYFRLPECSLVELRRVLRPGGRFVLVDWCDDYLSCKLCSLWLRWIDPAFYRTYSLFRCRKMLEGSGFVVETAFRRRIDWLWGLMCFVTRRV